jgi:hypothetical protein
MQVRCGCGVREVKQDNEVIRHGETDTKLSEEYKREGFISAGVFRVVIVEPKDSGGGDGLSRVGSTARKRAYMSLKKYLISTDRIITPNVDASLLNLVEREGKLTLAEEDKALTRNVYLFDIRKPDLKGYVDGLAPKR